MPLLVIMTVEDKIRNADELDDLISAEIPAFNDLELRELVLKRMIHDSCGIKNPNAACMTNKNDQM